MRLVMSWHARTHVYLISVTCTISRTHEIDNSGMIRCVLIHKLPFRQNILDLGRPIELLAIWEHRIMLDEHSDRQHGEEFRI